MRQSGARSLKPGAYLENLEASLGPKGTKTPRFAAVGLRFSKTGSLVCLVCMLVLGLMRLSLDTYLEEEPDPHVESGTPVHYNTCPSRKIPVLELAGLPVVGFA